MVSGADGPEARQSVPAVTAFGLHPGMQTAAAIELLIARMDGRAVEAPVIVASTHQFRTSTTR